MFAELKMNEDSAIESRVKIRYQAEIAQLQGEGFELVGSFQTCHKPLIAPASLAFGLLGREVMNFQAPFNVNWYHPLLRSADRGTLAYPMGLGIRFYTFFRNGKTIRTSNVEGKSEVMKRQNIEIHHLSKHSLGDTWLYHLAYCERERVINNAPESEGSIEKFLDAQLREDGVGALLTLAAFSWGLPVYLVANSVFKHIPQI